MEYFIYVTSYLRMRFLSYLLTLKLFHLIQICCFRGIELMHQFHRLGDDIFCPCVSMDCNIIEK
jgi:hypothetical protein